MNTKPTGPVSRRLAKQIAAQMKKRGWSPTQAATEAGLPHDAFRSILRGHKPNIDRAEEVCKALGITMVIGIERPTNTESANMRAACETPGAFGLAQSSILLVNTHSPWIADWMPALEDRRHAERWK